MKHLTSCTVLLMAALLAACSGGDRAAPPAPANRLLASTTAVAGPTVFPSTRGQYTITKAASGFLVTDNMGREAPVTVPDGARLRFADMSVALDIDGLAGKAYRIYKASFNREPDPAGYGFWLGALDGGTPLAEVAAGFVDSDEFRLLYGSNPTNAQVLDKIYRNVLGRAGDAGGTTYWLGVLDKKEDTLAGVLRGFSESDENKAGVQELIQNGIQFMEFGIKYPATAAPALESVKVAAPVVSASSIVASTTPALPIPSTVATPASTTNFHIWIYDPRNTSIKLASPGIFIQKDGGAFTLVATNADGSLNMTLTQGSYNFDVLEPSGTSSLFYRNRYAAQVSAAGKVTITGYEANANGVFTVTVMASDVKAKRDALAAFASVNVADFKQTSSCQLLDQVNPVRTISTANLAAGFPKNNTRLPSFGRIKALIVPVDFPDVNGVDAPGPFFTPLANDVRDFYMKQSYGRVAFDFEILPQWVRLPFTVDLFGFDAAQGGDPTGYVNAILALTDTKVDFTQYDVVYFLIPQQMPKERLGFGPAFSFPLYTRNGFIGNSSMGGTDMYYQESKGTIGGKWKWMAHETGHLFGLYDEDNNHQSASLGTWGIMAMNWTNEAIEHNGWDRYQQGWLTNMQVACMAKDKLTAEGSTVKLNPLVRQNSLTKLAMVPLSTSKILVMESRKSEGYDKISAANEGVLVYTVDMTLGSLKAGYVTRRRPGSVDASFRDAALRSGESVTVDGVVVTVVQQSSSGDTIRIGTR
jgi:M6 family metalloprotease-like protein